ncbi:hypothetical protein [Halorubrum sp. DTA46]|uniref:hypothetical protein n=1 Tax=Halorubrum sp. DTA46 TaxID=3402162 RepID=UPI003AAAC65B
MSREHGHRLSRLRRAVRLEDDECPECGWRRSEWAAQGRHGLEKEGHGEPEEDGSSGGVGGGGIGGLGPIR